MNYYKLGLNQSNKFWKRYVIFGHDIYSDELLSSEVEFEESEPGKDYFVERLKNGILPEFSFIGTDAVIAKECLFLNLEVSKEYISKIAIIEKESRQRYFAIKILKSIDCADLNKSDYEPWPEGAKLMPWHNPIGRFFHKPVLIAEKIPAGAAAFKIENWGGAYNIVVSEQFKKELIKINKADEFLTFEKLDVS